MAYSKPVLFVLALAIASIVAVWLFAANPKWPALALFLVVFIFVNPSYGFMEQVKTNVYAWGRSNKLPFPLMHFYLYGLFLAVLLRNQFLNLHPLKEAGGLWMILFALMFAGQFVAGIYLDKHWMWILQTEGLIHVLHMAMFVYIVISVLDNEKDLNGFVRLFLIIAVGRAVFGLIRFFFFGGDPQNAYQNYQELNLKITYWDIIEGLIATIAASYFLIRLTREWDSLKTSTRWLFVTCLLMEVLSVVLSFRRTALIGLLLALAYFLTKLPLKKRLALAAFGVFVLLPVTVGVTAYRTSELLGTQEISLMEAILPDVAGSGRLTDRESRFYELYVASHSIKESPLFGVGTWEGFKVQMGDAYALSYHRGNYQFVHSGFGHVLLKSGILGLFLFVGMLLAAWRFAGRARSYVHERHRAFFDAYRAGLLFMLPTLMFGTPIIEMRTMLWIGMVLAVPIAVARLYLPKPQPASQKTGSRAQLDAAA